MQYGIIQNNVTDLRADSDFRSERKSQLLYNEIVTITSRRGAYCRVTQSDGYTGWVNENAIELIDKVQGRKPNNMILSTMTARCHKSNDMNVPEFLFYGTKLRGRPKNIPRIRITGVDNLSFEIAGNNIGILSDQHKLIDHKLINELKKFLGIPYLWGGKTPFGLDCSGLVQLVFGRFGISLPRDSKDQKKIGRKVAQISILPGDLLFFPGHVAIAINDMEFIHASQKEGGVAINNFNKKSPRFRPDLHESLSAIRRILK